MGAMQTFSAHVLGPVAHVVPLLIALLLIAVLLIAVQQIWLAL